MVDSQTKSHTCIHTPGFPPMIPDDLSRSSLISALDGVRLVYFDGRLYETALVMAHEAKSKHIPILIDAKKRGKAWMISSIYQTISSARQNFRRQADDCISTSSPVKARHNMRDHVKGRLDYDSSNSLMNSVNPNSDGSSVFESDKEGDMFDLDLPNLDLLGGDFSLSELLADFYFEGDFSW